MCVKWYNREAIERHLAEAREAVATCPIAHVDMWGHPMSVPHDVRIEAARERAGGGKNNGSCLSDM